MMKKSVQTIEGKKLPLAEDFYSIQGEGYHTGKAAYFVRLGGCDVGCSWCDSPETWDAEKFPLIKTDDIVGRIISSGSDSVVITGGEPLMWNLDYLCSLLVKNKIYNYLETSGVHPLTGKWHWICLSPKRNREPVHEICKMADELKVVIRERTDFEWAEKIRRQVNEKCKLFLQPEWNSFEKIIPEIVDFVKKNSVWRISLQAHKYMNIP